MKLVAANLVFSTDTFSTAFTNINKLLYFCNTEAMSANSTEGTTTGNASLTGTFTSSNVAVTGALRGGTLSASADLNVSSNVIFNGALATFKANLTVNSIATFVSNSSFSGNSTIVVLNITGNSSVSEATLGGTNLKINSNVVANGSFAFNNTHTVVGNTSISGNSTVLAFSVTTNSSATNTYIAGTNVTINAVTTFSQNVFMSNLTVSGTLSATLGAVAADFLPAANATYSLGNSTTTWLAQLHQPVIYSRITPSANDVLLGNTTNRWAAAFSTANTSGAVIIGGNVTVSSTKFVVDATNGRVGVNTAPTTDALTVVGTVNALAFVGNSVTLTNNVSATGIVVGNTVIFSNTFSTSLTTAVIPDSFPKASYSTAKWLVKVKDSTTLVHSLEILAVHEGTNVLLTKFAEIFNTSLGTFDVGINGANVELQYTSSNSGTAPWVVTVQRVNTV